MKQTNTFEQLKQSDEARPGIPGEHWLTLALGLGAWWLTRRHSSFIVRTIGLGVATAMAGRAVSGRDGLAKLVRLLPVGRRA